MNLQGRNLRNFWLAFWKKRWPHKFILNLTDLYCMQSHLCISSAVNYLFQCFTSFYGFRWFCKEIGGFLDNFLEDLSELGSKSDPLVSSILELFCHHFLWYPSSISWHSTGFSDHKTLRMRIWIPALIAGKHLLQINVTHRLFVCFYTFILVLFELHFSHF